MNEPIIESFRIEGRTIKITGSGFLSLYMSKGIASLTIIDKLKF